MKINTLIKLIITTLIVFSNHVLTAKPGDLDSSFGENGISLPYKTSNYSFHCSTIDNNDNVLIAGRIGAFQDILTIQRVKKNGSLDSSFAINGTFSYSFVDFKGLNCKNIIETKDSCILVLGSLHHKNSLTDSIFLFKLQSNGRIDSTFHDNGLFLYGDSNYDFYPNKLIELPDESSYIVLCAIHDLISKKYYSSFINILPSGEIEPINGKDQYILYDSMGDLYITDFVIMNNKLLLGGHLTDSITYFRAPIILKLNEDFTYDNSFGQNGRIFLSFGEDVFISYIHEIDKGSIIISGVYYESNKIGEFLSKLYDSGQLDLSFGLNGISRTIIQDRDFLRSLNIIPNLDNRILISGSSGFDDIDFIWMQMFNKNGLPDSSFGTDSKIMTRYSTVNTTDGFTHLQKDDKIILIGEVGDPENCIVLYRYLSDFEVGVYENVDSGDIYIYPHPVNNIAYINYNLLTPDYIKFELYNYIGDKVRDLNQPNFRESGNHNEMINLGDNLEDGLYFLKFSSSIYTKIFKIQVSK